MCHLSHQHLIALIYHDHCSIKILRDGCPELDEGRRVCPLKLDPLISLRLLALESLLIELSLFFAGHDEVHGDGGLACGRKAVEGHEISNFQHLSGLASAGRLGDVYPAVLLRCQILSQESDGSLIWQQSGMGGE